MTKTRTIYTVYIDSNYLREGGEVTVDYTPRVGKVTGTETAGGRLKVDRTPESGFAKYIDKPFMFETRDEAIKQYVSQLEERVATHEEKLAAAKELLRKAKCLV